MKRAALIRGMAIPVLAFPLLALVACGSHAEEAAPAGTAQSAVSTSPVGASVHGPAKKFAEALSTVALRDDQRAAVEQMATDSEARHAPVKAARADLMNTLANEVQAGQLDDATLSGKEAALKSAMDTARAGDEAALDKLHALLDPGQRASFVDALEKQHHDGHGPGDGGGDWKGGPHERFKKLAEDLKLTDAQQAQARQALMALRGGHGGPGGDGGPHDGHGPHGDHDHGDRGKGKAFLDAFKSDTFSAASFGPPAGGPDGGPGMGFGREGHLVDATRAVLPILTADQRTIAATKLHDAATKWGPDGN